MKTSSSDLEFHGKINIPGKTYEDILAVALINLILWKYNEDLEDEDHEIFGSNNPPSNGQRNAFSQTENSSKQDEGRPAGGAVGGERQQQTNIRTRTDLKYNNHQEGQHSESSSLISTSSSSTASDSLCSSSSTTSYSTESSSPSSRSSSSSPSSGSQFRGSSYDDSLGLYLSDRREEGGDSNWVLKPQQNFTQSNPVFGLYRLNVKQSLENCLTNLTDDLKEKIEERNIRLLETLTNHSEADINHETDCEYTEKQFNSVIKWTPTSPSSNHDTQTVYLYLGEEIGESNTDDVEDEDNLLPVYETVQLFESLTIENSPLLSQVEVSLSRTLNIMKSRFIL